MVSVQRMRCKDFLKNQYVVSKAAVARLMTKPTITFDENVGLLRQLGIYIKDSPQVSLCHPTAPGVVEWLVIG